MKDWKDYAKWIMHHTWVITVSYVISMMALLFIHDLFGFSMAEEGTYLSNALMHIGSGFVLASGTGILQRELLKKHIKASFFWIVSLVIGFVASEIIAGIILWNLEIYRGLINVFNTDDHFPESLIFASAGLLSGIIQFRLLKPYYKKRFYWIIASTVGWGVFILSAYLGLIALLFGALLYGAVTGLAFSRLLECKSLN